MNYEKMQTETSETQSYIELLANQIDSSVYREEIRLFLSLFIKPNCQDIDNT